MKLRDLKTHALLKFNKINKLALLSGGCRLHRSNVIYFFKMAYYLHKSHKSILRQLVHQQSFQHSTW